MKNEFKKLIKSFCYAIEGIKFCIKHERNFKIHLCAVFYVLIFAYLAEFSPIYYSILILCFSQVLSAELLNTAIEVLCDKESTGYSHFIKRAKDIAAAAVLVCSISCVILGLVLFVPNLPIILENLNPIVISVIIITIPINLYFIRRK